ncbi:CD1107 family mobile element protein [Gudongella sp. SC589]|uniref:CD1107 family mobile element protein n=1 Tax=Gudongella sp. SC589 TaxID=3385990 RepID=UPI00390478EF
MKKILFILCSISLVIASVSIFPSTSLAADSEEIIIIDDERDGSPIIIGDENYDPDIYIEKEEGDILKPQENKTSGNQDILINSSSDTDNTLVEGGNEKGINPLATKENKARGTVMENVNRNGQDITPKAISVAKAVEEENPKKNPNGDTTTIINDPKNQPEIIPSEESKEIDVRQFLTFQTKSGKTFYLIVDHDKNTQNVQLLIEVGEQDLLNMVEGEKQVVNKTVGDSKTIEELQKEREAQEQVEKEAELEVVEEGKKNSSPIFFIAVLLVVGVAGYYFKIYKPKQEETYFDEDDYDDYDDSFDEYFEDDLEEEYIEDTENMDENE